MQTMKKLTMRNLDTFFENIKEGDIFTYSEAFNPQEIVELAAKKAVRAEYCPPGSPEYRSHGCFTMKIYREEEKQG